MRIFNANLPANGIHHGWVEWNGKTITEIGVGSPATPPTENDINADGLTLLPGFIDIHIHGAMGHDVMDASPDALREMSKFLAEHGVTSWLPTTLTNSHRNIMAALTMIQRTMERGKIGGAVILGAHLEGPYLNVEKAGAQNPEHIRTAESHDEVMQILDTGIMRLVDVAPEIEANRWLIEECVKRKITVSVAHSSAKYANMQAAFALGLSHSTHTFNAQTGLHHREPGIVGAVMDNPDITCELIADNIHVHPVIMRLLWATKQPDHLVLISDSIRAAGMPEGEYLFDTRTIQMRSSTVTLSDGTLAGSVLTLDLALKNFQAATQQPLSAIWQTSSLNAAKAIGVSKHKGCLDVSKDADLVLVDDDLTVKMTVVEGEIVYRNM